MQQHSLISKLCLLTLHFPRLRIIWSRSLHATADIFRALKTNQEEPDPVSAAAVGEHSAYDMRTSSPFPLLQQLCPRCAESRVVKDKH